MLEVLIVVGLVEKIRGLKALVLIACDSIFFVGGPLQRVLFSVALSPTMGRAYIVAAGFLPPSHSSYVHGVGIDSETIYYSWETGRYEV